MLLRFRPSKNMELFGKYSKKMSTEVWNRWQKASLVSQTANECCPTWRPDTSLSVCTAQRQKNRAQGMRALTSSVGHKDGSPWTLLSYTQLRNPTL